MSSRDAQRRLATATVAGLTADFRAVFKASPTPLLVVAPPDWTIVAANDARLRVTGTTREEQIGRKLFDAFPDDPDDPNANGVRNLSASLERVLATRATDTMAVQRYPLREADGQFVERWWAPVNTPVLGTSGAVELIIHHVEDVTEVVRLRCAAEDRDQLARTQQVVTDRLRTSEAAHRDAEERYLALFNAIDQGFCTIEVAFDEQDHPVDYRFLEISPSFERQTGIQNGAGRWMREIAPDQDQFWFDTYGRVALTGEPARFENYSTPLDRWWEVYAFRISGERRVAVLFRDITDQKRAEAALRQSEARLAFLDRLGAETAPLADADAVLATTTRLLGEHLSLSVCAYADMDEDQDGFTIRGDWSAPGATSIMGHYSLADFGKLAVKNLATGLPLILNDNLRELAPEEAATFQNIGIAATICMPLVKQGRLTALMAIHDSVPRVWTEAEISLLRAVTARSWAHVERVRAVAELRESEAQFRLMADAVPQIVWITDRHGRMEFLNKQFVDYTGAAYDAYEPAEMAANFIHPEDGAKVVAAFDAALGTGEPFEIEHRIRSAAGEDRWFLARAEPYHDPATGEIVRWFGASVDIHDRKLTEAALRTSELALRELTDTLERRVAERTAALEQAHEQLRQSQKLEAMGALTGGVAHDFNNLLTPIVGALDLLERKSLGGEREQRLIEGALASAERARVLVQRLLAFARRQPLQTQAVDVATLVRGMADLVASTSGPRIHVEIDIADDLPAAKADANQVEMALLNLAVNARDAMPDGGTLTISAKSAVVGVGEQSTVPPGSYVRLSVADTGVGMDEATLKRAVEPFFSTKGVGRGTGLGLSMVHGLASQLGGGLAISSRPGLGTFVKLYLPASHDAPPQAELSEQSLSRAAAGTVLLVDDQELVRISTADMLSELGYVVVEAASAEDALQLVDAGQHFDVLITDQLMPGLSGSELAQEMRHRRPQARVLVISGYAKIDGIPQDVPRLLKPFRQADLAAKLDDLVSASPGC